MDKRDKLTWLKPRFENDTKYIRFDVHESELSRWREVAEELADLIGFYRSTIQSCSGSCRDSVIVDQALSRLEELRKETK